MNRVDMLPRAQLKQNARSRFGARRGACIGVLVAIALMSGVLSVSSTALQNTLGAEGGGASLLMPIVMMVLMLFVSTLGIEASYFFLRIYREEKPVIGDFFAGITQEVGRKIKGALWQGLWIYLWALPVAMPLVWIFATLMYAPANYDLLLVGGIGLVLLVAFLVVIAVKSLSYAMYPYILRDCPQVSVREGLRLSVRMMKGNKGRLCILMISFWGWVLLATLPAMLPMVLANRGMGLQALLMALLTNTLNAPDGVSAILGSVISFIVMYGFVSPYLYTAEAGFYDELKRASLAAGSVSDAEVGASRVWEQE